MNRTLLIAAAALIGVAAAGFAITDDANGPAIAAASKPMSSAQSEVPKSVAQMNLTFAPIVKKVSPAVVNVYARSVVQQQANPLFANPMFQRFFGITPQMRQRVEQSLGSGVIVRSDGLILTNNHVIQGGQEIVVALADKREFKAKVVQADARLDLALLKVDTKGEKLPTIAFGNSDKVEVGDIVLAIGDPFGVGQTVTMGIVSAQARTQANSADAVYIQTDAAINPGNSGGALVTTDGRLIGINSSIYSNSGSNIGIGFAIPSNLAKRFVEGAGNGGTFKLAWFGAEGQTVTSSLASSLGLPKPEGVILKTVYPNGPAAKAGLKVGDVVLAMDGFPIDNMQTLNYRVSTHKPGDGPTVKIASDGKVRDVKVVLTAPRETPRATTVIGGRNPLTGAKVENLSPATALDLNMDASATGVVVTAVAAGTPASGYGFRPGDIVRSLNGQAIKTVGDLKRGLAASQHHWTLVVDRGGSRLTLSVSG